MNEIPFIILLLLTISGMLALYLSAWASFRKRVEGSLEFSVLMLTISIYIIGYAFELSRSNFDGMMNALRVEYIGLPFISISFLLFTLRYVTKKKLNKKLLISTLIIPFITVFIFNTTEYHSLYYLNPRVEWTGYFYVMKFEFGIWYIVQLIYQQGATILASIILLINSKKINKRNKKQSHLIVLAAIFPIIGMFLTGFKLTPLDLDILPFILTLTGLIIAIIIFKLELFELVPYARELAIDSIKDGLIVIDKIGRIQDINKSIKNLDITKNLSVGEFLPNDSVLYQTSQGMLSNPQNYREHREMEFEEGERFFQAKSYPVFKKSGVIDGIAILLSDITEHKKLIYKLEIEAKYDSLTKLYNRRHIMKIANKALKSLKHEKKEMGIIMMDIDYFKKINDSYGHHVGDIVLTRISDILKTSILSEEDVGRVGGEEFLIVSPNSSIDKLYKTAERINENINQELFEVEGFSFQVTSSYGIYSCLVEEDTNLDELLKKADKALYVSKENGRNKVTIFNDDMSN